MNLGNFMDEHHIKTVIGEDIFDTTGMSLNDESSADTNVLSSEDAVYVFSNWKKEVRKLLMAGYHSGDIRKKFLANVRTAGIDDEFVSYLRACDGLIGTIIVDCGCVGDHCKVSSKYKPFNRFAINCKCGHVEVQEGLETSQETGTINSFLMDNLEKKVVSKRAICKRCGLPVITSSKAIIASDVFSVVDELCNRGFITHRRSNALRQSKDLVGDLRKLFASGILDYRAKTFSDGKHENDINAYRLKKDSLVADANAGVKAASVEGLRESKKIKEAIDIDRKFTVSVIEKKIKPISDDIDFFDNFNMDDIDVAVDREQIKNSIEVDDLTGGDLDIDVGEQEFEEVKIANNKGYVDVEDGEMEFEDVKIGNNKSYVDVVEDREQIKNAIEVDDLTDDDLDIDDKQADIDLSIEKKVSNPEVDAKSKVSDEWFDDDEIEIDEFDKKAKEVKVANRFRFDF